MGTFVTASSLSQESHKAPSLPGQSRESRPENSPSDKEPGATGSRDLREEREQREGVFLSSAGRMTNTSQSQSDLVSDTSGIAIA